MANNVLVIYRQKLPIFHHHFYQNSVFTRSVMFHPTDHQEVITLVHMKGLRQDTQTGRSIGYRQALEHLDDVWGFPSADERVYQLKVGSKACLWAQVWFMK